MIALYKKELRGLLPLLVLVTFLFGSDFFFRPIAERVDEISWVEQSGQLEAGEGKVYAFFLMIMALIAAYSLFPREHDDGTIEFLYALPITRGQIFAAKALAGWTVLLVGVVLDQLAGATFQLLNPQSLSGEQWRFGLAVQLLLLNGFYSAVILAHGLLISFLRRFGLVVYALVALAVLRVKKLSASFVFVDPYEFLELRFHGTELIVPWPSLFFHGVAALAALALAYTLWMGPAERFSRFYAGMRSKMVGKVALGCVSTTFVLGGLIWMAASIEETEEAPAEQYRPFFPVRAETEYYDFTYIDFMGQRAQALLRHADEGYGRVAAFLGVEPGLRIDADLTDEETSHLGIAKGGVIRVALVFLSPEEALSTLYHETVHAFQFHLAGPRATEHHDSLRFFIEGSAVYVTSELLPDPEQRAANRRLAAAAYELHGIRSGHLLGDKRFNDRYDPDLVYALGETWTAALVEACGPRIIGSFFGTLARDGAPEDLSGLALWQDTLRVTDCTLEEAIVRWGQAMGRLVADELEFLDELPRLGGGFVQREADELVFQLQLDREVEIPAEIYLLRVRRGPEVAQDEVFTFHAWLDFEDMEVSFRVPEDLLGVDVFEFQFGQSIPGSMWPFYEEWQVVSF